MTDDRDKVATVGDLHDLKAELRAELASKAELEAGLAGLEARLTKTMFEEMGRLANAMMEHMTSLIRGLGDQWKTVEERLDAHIADTTVHRRPTRARRS
jgi:hypothetical protein